MGNEGWEVAKALAEQGIAAFVLKYRLHPTPEWLDDFKAWMNRPRPTPAASSDTSKSATPPSPQQLDLSNQLEDAEATPKGFFIKALLFVMAFQFSQLF